MAAIPSGFSLGDFIATITKLSMKYLGFLLGVGHPYGAHEAELPDDETDISLCRRVLVVRRPLTTMITHFLRPRTAEPYVLTLHRSRLAKVILLPNKKKTLPSRDGSRNRNDCFFIDSMMLRSLQ